MSGALGALGTVVGSAFGAPELGGALGGLAGGLMQGGDGNGGQRQTSNQSGTSNTATSNASATANSLATSEANSKLYSSNQSTNQNSTATPFGPLGGVLTGLYNNLGGNLSHGGLNSLFEQGGRTPTSAGFGSGPANAYYEALGGGKYLGKTMGDDLLSTIAGGANVGKNPYINSQVDYAQKQMSDNFKDSIAPSLNSMFSLAGRTGSTANAFAFGNESNKLLQNMGQLSANMYGNQYGTDRAQQMAALQQLSNVGLQERAAQLAGNNADQAAYQFDVNSQQGAYGLQTQALNSRYATILNMLNLGAPYASHATTGNNYTTGNEYGNSYGQQYGNSNTQQYGNSVGSTTGNYTGNNSTQPSIMQSMMGGAMLGGSGLGSQLSGLFGGGTNNLGYGGGSYNPGAGYGSGGPDWSSAMQQNPELATNLQLYGM